MGKQYMVVFGENTPGDDDFDKAKGNLFNFRWTLYILFSIIMNIVMLNLLISIISDDYERVQSTQMSTDAKAKCAILYELGQMMNFGKKYFCCRSIKRGNLMIVHRFVEESQGILELRGESSDWGGKIKTITAPIGTILEEVRDLRRENKNLRDQMADKNNELQEQMMELRGQIMEKNEEQRDQMMKLREQNSRIEQILDVAE